MPEASDTELFERAESLLQNGQTLMLDGDERGAIVKFEACRAVGKRLESRQLAQGFEGAAVGSLGIAYDNLGQHEKAIENYTAALAISRELGYR